MAAQASQERCYSMNKVLLALALAGLLLIGGGAWYLKVQVATVASLKIENKRLSEEAGQAAAALKRNQATLRKREAQAVSQARKLADSQRELQTALRANKSWSDTDVPPDVQKALSGLSGRAPDGVRHQDSERSPTSGASQRLPGASGAGSE